MTTQFWESIARLGESPWRNGDCGLSIVATKFASQNFRAKELEASQSCVVPLVVRFARIFARRYSVRMGSVARIDARFFGKTRIEYAGSIAGVISSATGFTRFHKVKVLNEAGLRRGASEEVGWGARVAKSLAHALLKVAATWGCANFALGQNAEAPGRIGRTAETGSGSTTPITLPNGVRRIFESFLASLSQRVAVLIALLPILGKSCVGEKRDRENEGKCCGTHCFSPGYPSSGGLGIEVLHGLFE